MEKMSKDQMWSLAKEVANHFHKEGYSASEIMEMDKHEMSKKMSNVEISKMPDKVSMYDGKDIDEDDTFPYFQTLVEFHYATIR